SETAKLVEKINNRATDEVSLRRAVHTLKGSAGTAGITGLAAACHRLESEFDSAPISSGDRSEVERYWVQIREEIQPLLTDRTTTIEVDRREHEALLEAIRRHATPEELERIVRAWKLEPLRVRLDRLAEQLAGLATRLGKGPVQVEVETDR